MFFDLKMIVQLGFHHETCFQWKMNSHAVTFNDSSRYDLDSAITDTTKIPKNMFPDGGAPMLRFGAVTPW